MPTINNSEIVVGGSRDLLKASMKLHVEVFERTPALNVMKTYGLLNYQEDLTRKSGTSITMYNIPRIDSKGTTGDYDRYSAATEAESGDRTVSIRKIGNTMKYSLEGTERQQVSEFDLKADIPRLQSQWIKNFTLTTIFNQSGGNTANSVTVPSVASTAFTTTEELARIRGNNATVAPTSIYKAIGANGVGSITTDEGVDSDNILKLSDFMYAREIIRSTTAGVPKWNVIGGDYAGKPVDAIAFVGTTGINQLKLDAAGSGNALTMSEIGLQGLAGGKQYPIGPSYWMENILFVEVDDDLLPRGVNSSTSAPVANTRRAIIMGRGAVDMAVGQGYKVNDNVYYSGFQVKVDEEHEKLNQIGYCEASFNFGVKKAGLFGQGTNAATRYDLASYVITHYSRT